MIRILIASALLAGCAGGGVSGISGANASGATATTPTAEVVPLPAPPAEAGAHDADGVAIGPADAGTSDGAASRNEADAAAVSGTSLVIGPKDNGKTLTAKKGQDLLITLPGNPTTGYDWTVARVDKTLGQPTTTYAAASAAPGLAGGGGARTFTWSGKSPLDLRGTHDIELQYKRSWEPNAVKTFTVKITVVD